MTPKRPQNDPKNDPKHGELFGLKSGQLRPNNSKAKQFYFAVFCCKIELFGLKLLGLNWEWFGLNWGGVPGPGFDPIWGPENCQI